jgi:hypothetical protein
MPGTANFEEEIGIIIDIHHFGAFGDAGYYNEFDRGHTLTHEMGHFLGLKHIWGNGNSVDCNDSDDIDDTPNQAGRIWLARKGCRFRARSMTCIRTLWISRMIVVWLPSHMTR